MGKISVLDCTLRDGGYCNQWRFGGDNIKKIIESLVDANIDIVECGFLTQKIEYDKDITRFLTVEDIYDNIPGNKNGKLFVCMVNYGEFNAADLPICGERTVDGIRVAFHKKDRMQALEFCKAIKEKGYKVFVQPMVSLGYTDNEFIDLIDMVNEFDPYAFYIVDSFGVMKRKDLIRLFYMVEHNLKANISIGYHSHNNMQLAYANAQALVDIRTNRNMIIDSSIFGMGRGAGNLNTELFVEYLNDNVGTAYELKPILTVIDEILDSFYQQNYWGYSLPNYLSAKYNAHPNYAGYLDAKKTLTVENMDEIFAMMDLDKRSVYDKAYIEDLYGRYMAKGQAQEIHLNELREKICGKEILMIAPGSSSLEEKEKIVSYSKKENVVTISVNFDYSECDTDFIFVSNLRRFRELSADKHKKCIITSNISAMDVYLQTKYQDLINNRESVRDNAGLMLIKLLMQLGAEKIVLAGLDGYSIDPMQNFADKKMSFYTQKATFESMNEGIADVLREYSREINLEFLTKAKYILL